MRAASPAPLQRERHRQRAVHRPQLAAERELAGELEARRARLASIWPAAARMPSAIGRSKRPDSFGRSAGARLTVTRLLCGNSSPLVCSAARTRSRDFLDLGVGQADEREARQAVGEVHLDRHRRRFEAAQGAAVDEGEASSDDSAGVHCAARRPKAVHPTGVRPSTWCLDDVVARRSRSIAGRGGRATALARNVRNEAAISTKAPEAHDEASR